MRFILPILMSLALLSLELFLREAFLIDSWAPDLVSLLILWLGMVRSLESGPVQALLIGLLADAFGGSSVGLHMLYAVLLFYVSAVTARRVRFQGFFGHLLIGLFGGFLALLLAFLVSRLFGGNALLTERLGDLLVPRIVMSVIAAPLLLPLFGLIDKFTEKKIDSEVF